MFNKPFKVKQRAIMRFPSKICFAIFPIESVVNLIGRSSRHITIKTLQLENINTEKVHC